MRILVGIVALALIIAGIAALAGRPFWSKRTDGYLVGSYPVQSGSGPLRPVSVDLDPSMNPVRLNLSGRVNPGTHIQGSTPDKSSYGYRIALSLGRESIQVGGTTRIDVETREVKPGYSVGTYVENALSTLTDRVELPRAGRYDILVSAAGHSGSTKNKPPYELSIGIYRNEHATPKNVMWGGIGLIVFGVLLGWLFGPTKQDAA